MSKETRDALLHSQLQESLRQEIMNGPAVSGALTYAELCVAAKNEERRLSGLKKWEQYRSTGSDSRTNPSHSGKGRQPSLSDPESTPYERSRQFDASRSNGQREVKRCLLCHKVGHLVKDCSTPLIRIRRLTESNKFELPTREVNPSVPG